MYTRFPPPQKIIMYILTLMLVVLVSCSKADVPAADKASASPVVSAADCRENQIKGYQTADLNKILPWTRFVLDMKHTSQVQLFRLSITTAAPRSMSAASQMRTRSLYSSQAVAGIIYSL